MPAKQVSAVHHDGMQAHTARGATSALRRDPRQGEIGKVKSSARLRAVRCAVQEKGEGAGCDWTAGGRGRGEEAELR